MSGGGKLPDDVSFTHLDEELFDGAGATKRDLIDYLDAVQRSHPSLLNRPAAVCHPYPTWPAPVHAEEPSQIHTGLGAQSADLGRGVSTGSLVRPVQRSPYAALVRQPTGRGVPRHALQDRPSGAPRLSGARSGSAGGSAFCSGRYRQRTWSAKPSPKRAWLARSRPAVPRACTCSCR